MWGQLREVQTQLDSLPRWLGLEESVRGLRLRCDALAGRLEVAEAAKAAPTQVAHKKSLTCKPKLLAKQKPSYVYSQLMFLIYSSRRNN